MSETSQDRDASSESATSVTHPDQDAVRTAQIVRAVETAVRQGLVDIKVDLARLEARGHSDYNRILMIFGAGFLALTGLFGWGYTRLDDHIGRLEDRFTTLGNNQTRTDQKLQDFIDRVALAPQPLQRRP